MAERSRRLSVQASPDIAHAANGGFDGPKRVKCICHRTAARGRAPALAQHLAWENDRLTGAALVGDAAAEMIAPLAALVGLSAKRDDLARPTGVHPSFAEEFIGR